MKKKHLIIIVSQAVIIVALVAYSMIQRIALQATERDALAQHEQAYQSRIEADRQREVAERNAMMAEKNAEEARRQAELAMQYAEKCK